MAYAIAILPNLYPTAPAGADDVRWVCGDDDNGELVIYSTAAVAQAAVDMLESQTYYTQHNDAGRPEYVVVDTHVADYIRTGRGGDNGNYEWDKQVGCNCNGQGDCLLCIKLMVEQDRQYIRDNAALV